MDTTVEVYTAFMDHLQDMEDTDMEDNNTEDTMATTSFSFVEIVVLHFKTTIELHLRIVHFTFDPQFSQQYYCQSFFQDPLLYL